MKLGSILPVKEAPYHSHRGNVIQSAVGAAGLATYRATSRSAGNVATTTPQNMCKVMRVCPRPRRQILGNAISFLEMLGLGLLRLSRASSTRSRMCNKFCRSSAHASCRYIAILVHGVDGLKAEASGDIIKTNTRPTMQIPVLD